MGKEITIRVKLFSGIDKELKLANFNPAEGLAMTIESGKRLKWVLKSLGLTELSKYVYFRGGQRISTWARLREGDEVTCLRPSGGG